MQGSLWEQLRKKILAVGLNPDAPDPFTQDIEWGGLISVGEGPGQGIPGLEGSAILNELIARGLAREGSKEIRRLTVNFRESDPLRLFHDLYKTARATSDVFGGTIEDFERSINVSRGGSGVSVEDYESDISIGDVLLLREAFDVLKSGGEVPQTLLEIVFGYPSIPEAEHDQGKEVATKTVKNAIMGELASYFVGAPMSSSSMTNKKYNIKIYDSDGATYIKSLSPKIVKNAPKFASRINGGLGECTLNLNLPFDDFDEGVSIEFMNIVDIYAVTDDYPSGTRIYRGFISQYEPYRNGSDSGVVVTLLGLASLLSNSYYKNGASFDVTHTGADPETIGRAVIDHFNTIYSGSLLSYTDDTTDTVGQTVNMAFSDVKWFDALKKVGEISDTGWWWKIDADGKFWLKAKPSTVTHRFTIGRDVSSFSCLKDGEKVVNDVAVRYSGGTATATDATSQTTFGVRTKIVSDTSLANAAAGQQRADKEVGDNKDEKTKASITINEKYNLESIKVGETCAVLNYKLDSGLFGSNMQIVGLTYSGDEVRLELEEAVASFTEELDGYVNG